MPDGQWAEVLAQSTSSGRSRRAATSVMAREVWSLLADPLSLLLPPLPPPLPPPSPGGGAAVVGRGWGLPGYVDCGTSGQVSLLCSAGSSIGECQ